MYVNVIIDEAILSEPCVIILCPVQLTGSDPGSQSGSVLDRSSPSSSSDPVVISLQAYVSDSFEDVNSGNAELAVRNQVENVNLVFRESELQIK